MCLGTTITCKSCRRETIIFYPGGKCGEVEPFPSWHRIRGHWRRIRRCYGCIQIHRRAVYRENEEYLRHAERAKAVLQYFRGERSHPLPDDELRLCAGCALHPDHLLLDGEQDMNTNLGGESPRLRLSGDQSPGGESVQLFNGQSEQEVVEFLDYLGLRRDAIHGRDWRITESIVENPECLTPELTTPEQETSDGDEVLVVETPETLPGESNVSEQETRQTHWREFRAGRRLHPFDRTGAEREFYIFRATARSHPENTILASVEQCMQQCITRQADIDATAREVTVEDQHYMFGPIALAFDHQQVLSRRFGLTVGFLEAEDDDYSPDYRDEEYPECGDLEDQEFSFLQWTSTYYEGNSAYNMEYTTQEALDVDLDNYEWYLRNFGNEIRLDDFIRRHHEISTREFDFDPGYLNAPTFPQWLATENLVRQATGMDNVPSREALGLYWAAVINYTPAEIQEAADSARIRHFEETRRELYSHARNERCPLIERLRSLRAQAWQIMAWAHNEYPSLDYVQRSLDATCRFLTARIAIEREPTDEQWSRMQIMGRAAVELLRVTMTEDSEGREVDWEALLVSMEEDGSEPEVVVVGLDESDDDVEARVRAYQELRQRQQSGLDGDSDDSESGVRLDIGSEGPVFSSDEQYEDDDGPDSP
jgi:hypothetical protein